jgi:DNA-binding response OmpR family regulator
VTGKVLVVEDDSTLTRAIARNLEARGHETACVGSVAEALAAIDAARPALLLLDIDLPDGSGWEVLRGLREKGGSTVPVIVISALRPNPRLTQEFHCFGVLEKPFPMEALMRKVSDVTEHTGSSAPTDAGA